MAKRKQYDPLAEFRKLSKADQSIHILEVAERCIDAAPVSLARKIEIFLTEYSETN